METLKALLVSMRRLSLAAVLLTSACSAPFLAERAAIAPGWDQSVGLAGGVIPWCGWHPNSNLPYLTGDLCAGGWLVWQARYGFSERLAWFAHAGGGTGIWLTHSFTPDMRGLPVIVTVGTGIKFRIAEGWALRTHCGYPGLLNLTIVHDVGERLTLFGWGQYFDLGVGGCFNLASPDKAPSRLSLAVGVAPNTDADYAPWKVKPFVSLGFSLGGAGGDHFSR